MKTLLSSWKYYTCQDHSGRSPRLYNFNINLKHNFVQVTSQSLHSFNLKCVLGGERPLNFLVIHEDNSEMYSM